MKMPYVINRRVVLADNDYSIKYSEPIEPVVELLTNSVHKNAS